MNPEPKNSCSIAQGPMFHGASYCNEGVFARGVYKRGVSFMKKAR